LLTNKNTATILNGPTNVTVHIIRLQI